MSRIIRTTVAALAALTLAAPLAAQTPQAILDRYNKAIDPQGVLPSLQGMKSTISMEAPSMGMSMTINSVAARPNLLVVQTEIPGLGTMRQGHDGSTVWATDPMQGPRIIAGEEAAALVESSSLQSMIRNPDQFSAMEAAGTHGEGADASTCVKFTWKSGRVTTDCFSNASGLLVRTLTKQVTQMGEVEAEMSIKDYRSVAGLMIPHRIETSMMGMQMIMTTTSVEFGPQPAELFALPPEVKALKP